MRKVSSHSRAKVFGLSALLSLITMGMSAPESGVTMNVGVWDDAGQLTDVVMSATSADGVFKAEQYPNGMFFFQDATSLTTTGLKTTLEVVHPTFGQTLIDLKFVPKTNLRVDLVYDVQGVVTALSPDLLPSNPAGAAGGVSNDTCDNAIAVAVGSSTAGSTLGATPDVEVGTCVTTTTAPGVWYSVTGTGNTMSASTCNGVSDYDTKVSVFCGDCTDLDCVNGNDDNCASPSGLLSTATWCSEAGATYYVLVHGFLSDAGNFQLDVSDDGNPCTGALACLPPVASGACCFADGSCSVLSEDDCDAQGGNYQGDDAACFSGSGSATSYGPGAGGAIPDNDPVVGFSSTINVPDSFTIGDVDFGIDVAHTWTGDLIVTLEHGGVTATMVDRAGVPAISTFGCPEDNWAGVVIDDEGAGGAMEDQCLENLTSPPNYTPASALSAFDGMDAAGDWTMTITDNAAADTGSVNSWSLSISGAGDPICPPAECFLVIGDDAGAGSFVGVDHEFDTQVADVQDSYPVLMSQIPEFVIPMPLTRGSGSGSGRGVTGLSGSAGAQVDLSNSPEWMQDGKFAIQVLMWNPTVFPGMPEQYTAGLEVEILPNGKIKTTPYGTDLGGLTVEHEIVWNEDRQLVIRFPFAIPGL